MMYAIVFDTIFATLLFDRLSHLCLINKYYKFENTVCIISGVHYLLTEEDPQVKTFDQEPKNQTAFLKAHKAEGCTIPKISLMQLEGILILLCLLLVMSLSTLKQENAVNTNSW